MNEKYDLIKDWCEHCGGDPSDRQVKYLLDALDAEDDNAQDRSDHDGPLCPGWQVTIGPGHSGFGAYAHLSEYPDEGAVLLASNEIRECCNPDCDWSGKTGRTLGSIGPLCPLCAEVTEPVGSAIGAGETTPGTPDDYLSNQVRFTPRKGGKTAGGLMREDD